MWLAISEPATLITDWLITAASVFFALRLESAGLRFRQLWRAAFLVAAAAAFVGGAFHGFPEFFGSYLSLAWNITVFLIGSTAGLMIAAASITPAPPGSASRRYLITGLLIIIAGLPVLIFQWGLHSAFNHNDLYHCFQLIGLYGFFRGASAPTTAP